jgi:cysteine desulfurase/selenocysteine lyase
MDDWQNVIRKRDFPMIARGNCRGKSTVYLDNAATTQCPRPVLWAMEDYWSLRHANVHRGVYCLSVRATEALEETRQLTADFLRVSRDEIVFTSGATDSANMLAEAFALGELKRGDLVLATEMEHNSNLLPWLEACRRTGAVLELVKIREDGELDMEDLYRRLEKKPRLLAVTAVSNVLGTVNPLSQIVSSAHSAGAAVAVDAAQAMRCDLPELKSPDCDFLFFSGHKLMGPTGIGVLYAKAEWIDRLPPVRYGGGMLRELRIPEPEYESGVGKFEAGTLNLSGVAGLGAALEYLQVVGRRRIAAYERELLRHAEERLSSIDGLRILGAPKRRSGVLSFLLPPLQAYDAAVLLDKKGFALRSGRHCADALHARLGISGSVRLSPAFYNTGEELDRFGDALEQIAALSRTVGAGKHG